MKKFMLFYVAVAIVILINVGCSELKIKMFEKFKGGKGKILTKTEEINFEIIASHIMTVAANLDGNEIQIVLDTGGLTIIDKKIADSLNFEIEKIPNEDVEFAQVKETSLGGVSVYDLNAVKMDFRETFIAENFQSFGMIGSDFFRFFQTSFDYQNQKVFFSNPKKMKANSNTEHLFKMKIILPYFPTVKVVLNNEFKIKGMIDTGLNYAFVLPVGWLKNLSEEERAKAIKAKGFFAKWPFTEEPNNHLYLMNEIKIGDIVLKNEPVIFAELPPFLEKDVLLIGKYFLDKYITTLDYKHKQVLFTETEPNNISLNYSFGMYVFNAGDKFKIKGIWENSPADKAGILLSDKLISVNDMKCDEITNFELFELMNDRDHKTVELVIEREGEDVSIELEKNNLF
ncbi:MAG TPA: hypothetical protein ENL20_08335 [Candidatus Cloacimonetes bacterium]|nr:hypothetical protein [Candidatus Cloacimonadota bacterium]